MSKRNALHQNERSLLLAYLFPKTISTYVEDKQQQHRRESMTRKCHWKQFSLTSNVSGKCELPPLTLH